MKVVLVVQAGLKHNFDANTTFEANEVMKAVELVEIIMVSV